MGKKQYQSCIEKQTMVFALKLWLFVSFWSQIKCSLSGLENVHKMMLRIANSEDPDQTASSEAVWSGSALFV